KVERKRPRHRQRAVVRDGGAGSGRPDVLAGLRGDRHRPLAPDIATGGCRDAERHATRGAAVTHRAGVGRAVGRRPAELVVGAARTGRAPAAIDVGLALVLDAVGAGRRHAAAGGADTRRAVGCDAAHLGVGAARAYGAAAVHV